jgi:hypothetical protein
MKTTNLFPLSVFCFCISTLTIGACISGKPDSGGSECIAGYSRNSADECVPICGDGNCVVAETAASCPSDCGPNRPTSTCGDGKCDVTETHTSCPGDCPDTASSGCGSGKTACAGGCIPSGTKCCGSSSDGTKAVYCYDPDATCVADSSQELGWRCACPSGQKFCDSYCIPEGASCCGTGTGALYCETGTCKPDVSQANGYGCFDTSTTSECQYDSDCGGEDYCEYGTCRYGECSYDGDCGSCSRCSDHQCVYCGEGPYGCYC